jgi:hypothetical protein
MCVSNLDISLNLIDYISFYIIIRAKQKMSNLNIIDDQEEIQTLLGLGSAHGFDLAIDNSKGFLQNVYSILSNHKF